jgi:hypothetical protein
MATQSDVQIVRDLAKQVAEIAADPIQDERRELWRQHNSFVRTRPLILCMWEAAWFEHPDAAPKCDDPFLQSYETALKMAIFKHSLRDDTIIEPWLTVRAAVKWPPHSVWGVPYSRIPSDMAGGAWRNQPFLKNPEDLAKLAVPKHEIDEDATRQAFERLHDAVGDIMPIDIDRAPIWFGWNADISTDLFYLRGLDQMMLDMTDNPAWLHELLAFMRDGIVKAQNEAEAAGDLSLANQGNQAMTYSQELSDPKPNSLGARRSELWVFFAAQEFALVSPRMHDEFLLQYQLPIMEKYGLLAYGCCEDLTHKIDMLRQVPNLRRISVTPVADPAKCAEQIGTDYVISWRPNPADMICCGFDPVKIRRVVRRAMDGMRGCHVDINLKDVQTVGGKPELLRDWVQIVRGITDEY